MKKITNTLDENQIKMAQEVSSILSDNGFVNEVKYDLSTIDIIVEIGKIKTSHRTKGRFRVFWDGDENYTLGYLPAVDPFFDGYAIIGNKWIRNISMDDVIEIAKNDVLSLMKFHNK